MPKKSILYSRTGDDGTSSLYTGERRHKTDNVFQTLGHIDELNSLTGLARHYCMVEGNGLGEVLMQVQCCLQELMSHVATPRPLQPDDDEPDEEKIEQVRFDESGELLTALELLIDGLDAQLPPLTAFILPSGGAAASHLHVARTTCRRAERQITQLVTLQSCSPKAAKFMNRLSDFFFAAGRFAAFSAEEPETVYRTGGDGTQRLSVVPTLRTAGSRAEPGPEVVSVKPGDGGSGNDSVMVPVMYGVTVLCITAVVVRRWQAAWFG